MTKALEFDYTELDKLAAFIKELNVAGVQYSLRRDSVAIEITVKETI